MWILFGRDRTRSHESPPSGRTHVNRGLEPTYKIYRRLPDGSEEFVGAFFTLEEAKFRVQLLERSRGGSHYIYDSLKKEVVGERSQPNNRST
jgi:hypothetical protein